MVCQRPTANSQLRTANRQPFSARWNFIALAVLLPLYCTAQVNSFAFRNISINEGLSQSSVVDMAVDPAGFVWFATQDGLNRFDGKEFINFQKNFDDVTTPTGNRLGKIVQGAGNQLWLITGGGSLEKLDLYTQTFATQRTLGKRKLPVPSIRCLYANDNDLWMGTENEGLYVYEAAADRMHHFNSSSSPLALTGEHVQQIFRDSRQQYWVLTDRGMTMINAGLDRSRQFFGTASDTVACSVITEDKFHQLWMGSFGKGLFLKQESDHTFKSFIGFGKDQQLPADLVIEALYADEEGRLWIGTYGKGLYIVDAAKSIVHHILADKKNPFALGYNDVLSIQQDRQGGIWIGTDGGGTSYYDKRLNNFETYSRNNLPATVSIEQVRSIVTDKNDNIWAGTSNTGLTFIGKDPKESYTIRFIPFDKDISNYERIVSLLTDDDGDLWVGSQGNGIVLLDPVTRQLRKAFNPQGKANNYFPDHTVWCMLKANAGNVWIGTRSKGLCLLNKKEGVLKKFDQNSAPANRLLENNIRTLTMINDSILCIGFESKGIQLMNTRNDHVYELPGASVKKLFDAGTVIRSVYYDAPYLWVGTYGKGMVIINIFNGRMIMVNEKNGLPNNTVYGIHPDKSKALWLSTNKGISRLHVPQDPRLINRSDFTNFSAEDGLQSNEFNTGAHYLAPDGRLFFGGVNGLTVFDPQRMSRIYQTIPVIITSALVDNQPWISDTLITYKKHIEFSHSQNSFSFSFAALDVVSAGRLNYFYQLAGYDRDWVDAGSRNYAAYTNLPPGNYTFRVKASRHFSAFSQPVTTLTILIRPPFWKTWWFISFCILVAAAILYGIYRYRISQLLRIQQVRNNIASDLHDDIGSALTNISILSELSRKNLNNKSEAMVFLDRISEEVNSSGQALDDIVWSINTDNDSLEQTVARMRRYAAEVFDASGISYTLDFDEKFAQRKLRMEQRRDFLLLFKEAVNNIHKHAQAKNVRIETGIDINRLFMKIKDDGKGFDTKGDTHRNGLKNMEQRVRKWEGHFVMESGKDKGTIIRFSFFIV